MGGSASPVPRVIRAGLAVLAVAGLTACGGGRQTEPKDAATNMPAVVASTDVWGSVAESVAGNDANVAAIITSRSADPHSFEASPADAAAITDASVVVYNGGGYDTWVDTVLENHPSISTVDAYTLLDAAAVGEPAPANEHVFYELNTAKAVANQVADRLAEANPAKSSEYRTRAEDFGRTADAILQKERAVGADRPGTAVVATEPVAHYLLRAAGLTDMTPAGFIGSVEQDTDPAPVDVAAMLDLITTRQVAVLLYNDQTATEVTKKIRAAADSAGIPVVQVTETLPAGVDYLTWQSDTVDRLAAALRQNP
ncbi:MAG: metal ABC transporter solute-binding protein, Zn/Mn family [Mycobacterium sp.]